MQVSFLWKNTTNPFHEHLFQKGSVIFCRHPQLEKYKIMKNLYLAVNILIIGSISGILTFSSFYQPHWGFNWDHIRPEIKDSLEVIKRGMLINWKPNDNWLNRKKYWQRQAWLASYGTTNELTRLLEYPDGKIKTIAYKGLIAKNAGSDFELINKALTDTSYYVSMGDGHRSSTFFIGTYLVEWVYDIDQEWPGIPPEHIQAIDLTPDELEKTVKLFQKIKAIEDQKSNRDG